MKARLAPHTFALTATLGAAAAIRLYQIDALSLWLDEAHTFFRSSKQLSDLFEDSLESRHNPVYFVLMHYWMMLGDDELMMRLPAAFFGVLTVAVTYAAGVIVGGWRAGLAGAGMLAISPLQVRYSQEARMYTVITFAFALAASGTLWLAVHPERAARPLLERRWAPFLYPEGESEPLPASARGAWLCVILGCILALYMHNTALVALLAIFLAGLTQIAANPGLRLQLFVNWSIAGTAVFAAWSAWLPFFLSQVEKLGTRYWGHFTAEKVGRTFLDLFLLGKYSIPLAVLIAGCAIAGVWILRHNRKLLAAILILWLTGPVAIVLVSLHRSIFLPRIMLWTAIPFFVLVGAGLSRIRPTLLFIGLTAGLLAWGVATDLRKFYGIQTKSDWRRAARMLALEQTDPRVEILISPRANKPLNYYSRRKADALPRLKKRLVKPKRRRRGLLDGYVEKANRLWFVDYPIAIRRRTIGCSLSTLNWLDGMGRRVYAESYGAGLTLYRYTVDAGPSGRKLGCSTYEKAGRIVPAEDNTTSGLRKRRREERRKKRAADS